MYSYQRMYQTDKTWEAGKCRLPQNLEQLWVEFLHVGFLKIGLRNPLFLCRYCINLLLLLRVEEDVNFGQHFSLVSGIVSVNVVASFSFCFDTSSFTQYSFHCSLFSLFDFLLSSDWCRCCGRDCSRCGGCGG